MNEPIFKATRGLPTTFSRPVHVDGAGFSAIRAAVLAERQAYVNAERMEAQAREADLVGSHDVAAGFRRAARAERAAGRAQTAQFRAPVPSTFDGAQPAAIDGQLSLGV